MNNNQKLLAEFVGFAILLAIVSTVVIWIVIESIGFVINPLIYILICIILSLVWFKVVKKSEEPYSYTVLKGSND